MENAAARHTSTRRSVADFAGEERAGWPWMSDHPGPPSLLRVVSFAGDRRIPCEFAGHQGWRPLRHCVKCSSPFVSLFGYLDKQDALGGQSQLERGLPRRHGLRPDLRHVVRFIEQEKGRGCKPFWKPGQGEWK